MSKFNHLMEEVDGHHSDQLGAIDNVFRRLTNAQIGLHRALTAALKQNIEYQKATMSYSADILQFLEGPPDPDPLPNTPPPIPGMRNRQADQQQPVQQQRQDRPDYGHDTHDAMVRAHELMKGIPKDTMETINRTLGKLGFGQNGDGR